jgi:CheY-like chemotaxis protein
MSVREDEQEALTLRGIPREELRTLVAEDSLVGQEVVAGILEAEGHAVTIVADGKAVVAALEEGTFDCVLMDLRMPGMDGCEAAAIVRSRERVTGFPAMTCA